jgi:hypothetical protein
MPLKGIPRGERKRHEAFFVFGGVKVAIVKK